MAANDVKIVSMERTAAEKKAAEDRCMAAPGDGPDYPWGLCLNLGKNELDKLGIDDLPSVGDEFHIYAVCKVTRVSQSASEGGEDSKGVELQVTAMGAMQGDDAKPTGFQKAASKLYGKAEKTKGEA